MLRRKILSLTAVATLLSVGQAAIGQAYRWHQYNGHWYALTNPGTWQQAEDEAVAVGCHLVTLDNEDEDTWLYATFGVPGQHGPWIGLYQDCDSPECTDDPCEPDGCWMWIDGTPVTYTNWCSSEPNDAGVGEDWAEDHSCWNDLKPGNAGYPPEGLPGVIECATQPVPSVSEWGLVAMTLLVLAAGTLVIRRRRVARVA